MRNLPQRPRQHVSEYESEVFVRNTLPKEWLITNSEKDYGINLFVEIVESGGVTGAHFLMQLKSTDQLIVNKKGYVVHSCKTSSLQYFLERPELIIYLVYDSARKVGYWIWIQDYIRNDLDRKWKEQKTATIKLPKKNLFTEQSIEAIRRHILRFHKKEKLVNTIETLNHPGVRYGVEFDGNTTRISAYSKYPGADQDYPLNFGLTLNFGDSDEGEQAQKAWENAFKKGTIAKIESQFIKDFTIPDALNFDDLLGEKFKPDGLVVVPLKRDKKFSARIEVFDNEQKLVAQVPYVEFKETRFGTDESLFSNEEQPIPMKFSILLKFPERECTFSFTLNYAGWNVAQVKDALNLQQSFASSGWLSVIHLDTGITIINRDLPKNLISKPLDVHVEIANDLTLIQQVMKQTFLWPDKIFLEDQSLIKKAVGIIANGESYEGKRIGFRIDKPTAQKLKDSFSRSPKMKLILDGTDRVIKVFDKELNFGQTRILVSPAKPSKKTIKTFSSLELLDDDAMVKIDLEVDEPGITIQYINWLPNNKFTGE